MMNELVSVVIPIYNDYDKVSSVLEGFLEQSYQDIEVLLIDDGSEKRNDKLIEHYKKEFNKFYFYSHDENKGRSAARNTGIKYSSGDIIIFNDADRIPDKELVAAHVRSLSTEDHVISIGEIVDRYYIDDTKYFDRLSPYYSVVKYLYDSSGKSVSDIVWLTTFSGNMGIKKNEDIFFDELFNQWGFEHFELGYRLKKLNYKFVLSKKAKNYHLAHERANKFYKESVLSSCKIFYDKHSVPEVYLLADFIMGNLSLEDYEIKVMGFSTLKNITKEKLINKIINF